MKTNYGNWISMSMMKTLVAIAAVLYVLTVLYALVYDRVTAPFFILAILAGVATIVVLYMYYCRRVFSFEGGGLMRRIHAYLLDQLPWDGLGRMLGFKLQPNFNRPFISTSTGELWRRWHISLSAWVRDYVFTPLNASLRSWHRWGIYVSLLVTFVSIGVWHGAGWTFACYGLFQGILIIIETLLGKRRERLYNVFGQRVGRVLMIIRTYLFFAL